MNHKQSGTTATSWNCCRSCAWPGSASRCSSVCCWRSRLPIASQSSVTPSAGCSSPTLFLPPWRPVLLVAPVAYHRLVFRQHLKEPLVIVANKMAIAGLAAAVISMLPSATGGAEPGNSHLVSHYDQRLLQVLPE